MKVFDWSIDDYHNAIMDAMKPDYGWYTADMLRKKDKVIIKSISDMVESSRNQDPDDIWRKDPLNTPEEVVAAVCHDIRQNIEWYPGSYLKFVDAYNVPFQSQELGGGWMLERYVFSKYEGDVFFSSVTAGDRCTGSGRTFYIPGRLIKGHTYEEFLDAYFSEVASSRVFGLSKEELIDDGALEAFLGFA